MGCLITLVCYPSPWDDCKRASLLSLVLPLFRKKEPLFSLTRGRIHERVCDSVCRLWCISALHKSHENGIFRKSSYSRSLLCPIVFDVRYRILIIGYTPRSFRGRGFCINSWRSLTNQTAFLQIIITDEEFPFHEVIANSLETVLLKWLRASTLPLKDVESASHF